LSHAGQGRDRGELTTLPQIRAVLDGKNAFKERKIVGFPVRKGESGVPIIFLSEGEGRKEEGEGDASGADIRSSKAVTQRNREKSRAQFIFPVTHEGGVGRRGERGMEMVREKKDRRTLTPHSDGAGGVGVTFFLRA